MRNAARGALCALVLGAGLGFDSRLVVAREVGHLLRDVHAGPGGGNPESLVVAGTRVFFSAVDARGRGLWASDGRPAGTRRVSPPEGPAPEQVVPVGGDVFFVTTETRETGRPTVSTSALWRSDGTPGGTAMVYRPLPGTVPTDLTV